LIPNPETSKGEAREGASDPRTGEHDIRWPGFDNRGLSATSRPGLTRDPARE